MKLLFDHNLSPRLVNRLSGLFPDSSHIYLLRLDQADDRVIREYARQHDFLIVTKDTDFSDLCLLLGFPPKVIGYGAGTAKPRTLRASCGTTTMTLKPSQ